MNKPNYLEFAMTQHNNQRKPIKEEKEIHLSEYGGVTEYLDHDHYGYEEEEGLEVEYCKRKK